MEGAFESHPLATHFHQLTPEHVLDAVELGGARCTGRFLALNSYENRVYQLELEDERMIVAKFYRPGRWSREAIAEEHALLAELDELEIPVISPLELRPGETIGEIGGILFSVFPRVGGRAPEELNDEQVAILGRMIARIHNVGAARPATHRRELGPQSFGRDNLAVLRDRELIHPQVRDAYLASAQALIERIEPLFADVPLHRIHGDAHLGNLLWARGGPVFLDFDDMAMGPAAQDVWMLVPSHDAEGARQRELLLSAYRELRPFDARWLQLVEPLRGLRYINYSAWIARRWQDPAFQRTFNFFGTQQYWEGEVLDLREQIARVDQLLEAVPY